MSSRKLYLITDDYPYGNGEGSFIEPELPYLKRYFDITVISCSLSCERTAVTDPDIKVIHYDRQTPVFMKLVDTACYLGHKESLADFGECMKMTGKAAALKDSVLFFEEARRFKRFLIRTGLAKQIRQEGALIYTFWYSFYAYTFTKLFGGVSGVDLVTRAHRYELYDEAAAGGRQPFKAYMNRYERNIVFIAEHGRKYFISRYDPDGHLGLASKCRLFRLGVKALPQTYVKEKADEFVLVSCSTLIPRKRVGLITAALMMLAGEDARIRWVHFGDGPERQKIAEDAAMIEAQSAGRISCELKGNRPTEEIHAFYSQVQVDAFVTTTESEGCPVSVQEAMAYGIPVIGTEVAEIPYMIDGNGILLKENPTPAAVADAIRRLMNMNDGERMRMREASSSLWQKNFNADVNSAAFTDWLHSPCEG